MATRSSWRVVGVVCAAWTMVCGAAARAQDWPQWRGPNLDGSSPATGLPERFGPDEGVAWKADLPGGGASTPVVAGDRVFVSAQGDDNKTWAVCLDRRSGAELWRREVGQGFTNKHGNTAASPSPVASDRAAFFLFGSGDFAAFDHDGKALWKRDIQKDHGRFEMLWDFAASPLLFDGRIFLAVLHGDHRSADPDKSYVLCIDPASGLDLWKTDRRTGAASEGKQAYSTPCVWQGKNGPELVVTGGDRATGHDPRTGHELWRSESYNLKGNRSFRTVSSPVVAGDTLVFGAPFGNDFFALRRAGDGRPAGEWAWTLKNAPDVSSPAAAAGKLWTFDGKDLRCIDARDGRELGRCNVGPGMKFESSPTVADGKIYGLDMKGNVLVFKAAEPPELLHKAPFGGSDCRASVAVAGTSLFVRTGSSLFRIGARD